MIDKTSHVVTEDQIFQTKYTSHSILIAEHIK